MFAYRGASDEVAARKSWQLMAAASTVRHGSTAAGSAGRTPSWRAAEDRHARFGTDCLPGDQMSAEPQRRLTHQLGAAGQALLETARRLAEDPGALGG